MNNHSEQEKLSETTNQNTNQNKQTEFSRQEDPSGARQGERLEEVKITKRRSRYTSNANYMLVHRFF